ncbi:MAG: hypothetical protein PHS41_08675 [Victivallaceae bacterium]|nr:hypothetical protein [Victivallaceae bacterium]
MEYVKINRILDALKGELEALPGPAFQEVRISSISGYETLFEAIPELTGFPAAVISPGGMEVRDLAASRTVELAVFVIDEYAASDREKAISCCEMLDEVYFLLSGSVPGAAFPLAGGRLLLEGMRPVDLDAMHVAWQFICKVSQSMIA